MLDVTKKFQVWIKIVDNIIYPATILVGGDNMYYYYKIENKLNGHKYIGITIHPNVRKNRHFNYLKQNMHGNTYLQSAFNKYGEENFFFEVIEQKDVVESEAYAYEKELIEKFDSFNNGYNLHPGGKASANNKRFTEQQIFMMLAAHKKAPRSGTVIANIFNAPRGSIQNVLRGINYHNLYEKFNSMSEEEQNQYYEDFCDISNFRYSQYSAKANSKRTYSQEDVFLILLWKETKLFPFKKLLEIFNKDTYAAFNSIWAGRSYKDYNFLYQQLTKEEKQKLTSLYTEKYIEKPLELLETPFGSISSEAQ